MSFKRVYSPIKSNGYIRWIDEIPDEDWNEFDSKTKNSLCFLGKKIEYNRAKNLRKEKGEAQ